MHPTRTPARTSLARLPHQALQPPRRLPRLCQHPRVIHRPPPRVTRDGACDAAACRGGSAHDEVEEDEGVWEVEEGDGDENSSGERFGVVVMLMLFAGYGLKDEVGG